MVSWINFIDLENSMDDIEKKLAISLPNDLKDIIKKFNKGMPKPNKIPLGNEKFAILSQLLSFNFDEELSVYSCMTPEMKKNKIIPLAITSNNNFVCLKNEKIILYNIEHNAEKFICDTFNDLLLMLN